MIAAGSPNVKHSQVVHGVGNQRVVSETRGEPRVVQSQYVPGGGTGGGGSNKDKSSSDYQRKQWEAHKLVMDGGILKLTCATCGLNFTHGTKQHDAWKAGTYTMSPNHPLYVFNKQIGKTVPAQEGQKRVQFADQQGAGGGDNGGNALSLSRSSLEARISNFERTSTDPNASVMAEMFRQFLN